MTEDELIQKMENIIKRYERVLEKRTKQRNYLINYIAKLVLPVQLNALIKKMEEIADEYE